MNMKKMLKTFKNMEKYILNVFDYKYSNLSEIKISTNADLHFYHKMFHWKPLILRFFDIFVNKLNLFVYIFQFFWFFYDFFKDLYFAKAYKNYHFSTTIFVFLTSLTSWTCFSIYYIIVIFKTNLQTLFAFVYYHNCLFC